MDVTPSPGIQGEEMEVEESLLPPRWRATRTKYTHLTTNVSGHPSLNVLVKDAEKDRKCMTKINLNLKEDFSRLMAFGVHAMAWDEDTGRLVIATKLDRKLHVFDFSYRRMKGEAFVVTFISSFGLD